MDLSAYDCLYSFEDVNKAIAEQAMQLNRDFANSDCVCITVMNGGMIYTGMLLPRLHFLLELDYVHATRYRNSTRGYELEWVAKPKISLLGKTVLLLDDIYDQGITLSEIEKNCLDLGAKTVEKVVMLTKKITQIDAPQHYSIPKYSGLNVPDRYVFGMGMDYEGKIS